MGVGLSSSQMKAPNVQSWNNMNNKKGVMDYN